MPISKLTHGNKHMAVCFSWTWGGYLVKVSRALARSWTRTTGTNNAVKRTVLFMPVQNNIKQSCWLNGVVRGCYNRLRCSGMMKQQDWTAMLQQPGNLLSYQAWYFLLRHAWTSMSIRQALTTCWNMFEQCCSFNTPVVHCKKKHLRNWRKILSKTMHPQWPAIVSKLTQWFE